MRVRSLGALSIGIVLFPIITFAQTPRDRAAVEAPTGTGRLRGRIVAADTGSPLRRAQVRAVAATIRTTRLTTTDAEGRYEFANLPAARYTISVSKAGYVGLEFGQRRPFEGGRPLDIADAQIVDGIDFALPRGAVIAGRITDDQGDPIIGASVQAMRYQYGPTGQRRLGGVSQSWLSGMTNDLGEYRLFGLMPGTYIVSAIGNNFGVVSLTQAGPQTGGLGAIDTRDGYIQTYFPGTASVAEAQPVLVNLSEEANASFSLATGRMSRISGFVRNSDGQPATSSTVSLRPDDTNGAMGGWGDSRIAPDGSFSFANVPPGQFILEVNPARDVMVSLGRVIPRGAEPPGSPEFARMPIAVGGNDVTGLAVTTRPGMTVSGRVIFPGNVRPKAPEGAPLRVSAAFQNPVDGPRTMYLRPDNGAIDESGRFQLRDVTGQVLFRVSGATVNLVTKSVVHNGADITNTAYDASRGDIAGLEIVMGAPAQVSGTATNVRGEAVRDFRVALFPAQSKPSWLTTSFMRTGGADPNGRFQFNLLPAGDYLGVAVESFEQGEEWDPAFQQRFLPAARRFTLKEGQTLTIELPYVE